MQCAKRYPPENAETQPNSVGGPADLLNHFLEKVSRHLKNVLRVEKKTCIFTGRNCQEINELQYTANYSAANLRWNAWLMSGRSARSPQYGKHVESM
jgi:hypothetical protein